MNISGTSSNVGSLFSSSVAGIHRAIASANTASEQIANDAGDVEPIVNLDQAAIQVKLNTVALRTGDEMIGTLLNIKS